MLFSINTFHAQDQKDIVITLVRKPSTLQLSCGELDFFQKRIQQTFQKEKYLKCIKRASYQIARNKQDKVTYYYLALSTFKIYEQKLNTLLFDRTLKFLKASDLNINPMVIELKLSDKILLDLIHDEAVAISEKECKINRNKSLRRLQYVADIFQDSTDLFKEMIALENNKSFHLGTINKIEDKVKLKTVADLVVQQLEGQLKNNTNQQKLSEFLINELGLKVDVYQAKVMDISASQYGVNEFEGSDHNKDVIKYFKETGHNHIKKDETSWCSAYMSWCAKKAGMFYSKSLLARSWLKIGTRIMIPQPGDIVVFWREKVNSWEGHVSIYLYEDKESNQIFCLGGNQDGKVCVAQYPSNNVLGYRRLKPIN